MEAELGHILFPRGNDDGAARGKQTLVITAVLTGFSILLVALRMYTRVGLMKVTGREDWTILASLAFAIGYLSLVAAQFHFGLGRHSYTLPDWMLKEQLKRLWAAIPMYNASLGLTKISILFQYLRIFPGRHFRVLCYAVMGIVIAYTTWAVVSGYAHCRPVARFWDRDIPGFCLSFQFVWFFNSAVNIATDLALLIMPMPLISQLQLPRRQKIALIAVFAVGGFVVITSILRLFNLHSTATFSDASWTNIAAASWTAAECNVAIICACLPFLRPLVSRIFPKFLSSDSYKKYGPSRTTRSRSRSRTTALSRHLRGTQLRSQDPEFGLVSMNVDVDAKSDAHAGPHLHTENNGGIEVTTEVIQEVTPYEATSQRRLVMES